MLILFILLFNSLFLLRGRLLSHFDKFLLFLFPYLLLSSQSLEIVEDVIKFDLAPILELLHLIWFNIFVLL